MSMIVVIIGEYDGEYDGEYGGEYDGNCVVMVIS